MRNHYKYVKQRHFYNHNGLASDRIPSCTKLFYTLSCFLILFNPFAPGDFAEKRVLKLVEWFSGHCRAIKS